MHVMGLVELAVTVARHARVWGVLAHRPTVDSLPSPMAPPPDAEAPAPAIAERIVQEYWLLTRFRHDGWMESLSRHRDAIAQRGVLHRRGRWHDVFPVLQEILLSECLARIVAHHASALIARGEALDIAPLANGCLGTHLEARHRCFHLIVHGHGLPVELAARLNRIRRCVEWLVDQLLLAMPPAPAECGFDGVRAARGERGAIAGDAQGTWSEFHTALVAAAFRTELRADVDARAASGDLNRRLARCVLRMLPSILFDGHGIAHRDRYARLATPSPESPLERPTVEPTIEPISGRAWRP